MKAPSWFWIGMTVWLVIGIPAFLVCNAYRGSFSLLPDPPPYFQYPYEDRTFFANVVWLLAVVVIYAPAILVPLLFIRRRLARRKTDA